MRRKGGSVTEEELKLWRAAMRDAEPLTPAQIPSAEAPPEAPKAPPLQTPPERPPPVAAAPKAPERRRKRGFGEAGKLEDAPPAASLEDFAALLGGGFGRAPKLASGPSPAPPRAAAPPPPPTPFVAPLGPSTPGLDRRTAQRLARGDKRPEDRLDLHGMTLERAHAALIWFVLGARLSGKRMVLVVTGKGGDYQARALGLERPRETSLRDSTPRWLGSPPLSQHVNGVYQAHERHGGGGALYIYLRKS